MNKTRTYVVAIVAVALLASALMLASVSPIAPAIAQSGVTNLTNLVLSGDLTVGDDITASGDLTVSGDIAGSGNTAVADYLRYTVQATELVTHLGTIVPTGTYQPISATVGAAVATGSVTAGTSGDVVILVNVGNQTITISDTGTLLLSGNTALGENDTLTLLSDGTNWLETAQADN